MLDHAPARRHADVLELRRVVAVVALDAAAISPRRMVRSALLAWGFCVVYAISDEWHQTFVPTRVGTPWDVLIDAAGAALGLALAGLWRRVRSSRRTVAAPLPEP